jgi:hypothetical protein
MRRKAPLSESVEERVEAGACDDRMHCRTAYTVGAITEILNAFGGPHHGRAKLPNWVSSASDHSLPASAAGGSSSTAVPFVRGLSIEEVARVLRRDHREVRDKVAEVGRACR